MGRGRAKAKQTKVARQLKYASGDLDIDALSAELGTPGSGHGEGGSELDDAYVDEDTDDDERR
jgi:hypothetical protein